jgi:hypothetical protein
VPGIISLLAEGKDLESLFIEEDMKKWATPGMCDFNFDFA